MCTILTYQSFGTLYKSSGKLVFPDLVEFVGAELGIYHQSAVLPLSGPFVASQWCCRNLLSDTL